MGVPAQVAGEELERLERKHRELTPTIVLDSARSEKSVLHKVFEWNDTKAAEKYRLQQAGLLIANLTVKIEGEQNLEPTRAFVNIEKDERKGRFINVQTAFQYQETREVVLQNALKELISFKKKYAGLNELAKVFESIEAIETVA